MQTTHATAPERTQDDLVADGDVIGLLDELLQGRQTDVTGSELLALTKCVRRKAALTPAALGDDLFAVILSTAGTVLARCALYIGRELTRHDEFRRSSCPAVPEKLREEWLQRFERQSRFIVEIMTAQASAGHVQKLAKSGRLRPAAERPEQQYEPIHHGHSDVKYGPDGHPLPPDPYATGGGKGRARRNGHYPPPQAAWPRAELLDSLS